NSAKTELRRDRADFKQPTAKDSLPHDLADSNDEDLVNVDDGDDMLEDVARGHDSDVAVMIASVTPQNLTAAESLRVPIEARGDHAAHWANLLGEIVREFPMHFRSWHNIPEERKTRVMGKIGIAFWYDPKNVARCAQNAQKRAKSTIICRQGSRLLVFLRDRQMERSATREYPSMIQTYFDTYFIHGIFLRDEERLLYGLGTYTDDQIVAIVRRGKQREHIPDVGRVLTGRGRDVLVSPEPRCTHTADVDELKRTNKQLMKQMDMIMKVVRSDDKMSQLLTELQAQHDVDSGSGSGEGEDDRR
nr:hypothetical protein [Tanacetum cinerariifolium]